jgi:antibiotic biosynthesis monooxygenase (ABM) superfamily enzyme
VSTEQGATVVITHRVRDGQRAAYEEWLNEISPISRSFPGNLDWHLVRPVAGLTGTYSVIIRYDTREHLENWLASQERNRLVDKVRPLLVSGDDFFIRSGLDFWFSPDEAKAKVPVRWKQYLVTLSALYPLALGVPLLVTPLLRQVRISQNRYLDVLCITGAALWLMVYVVMPRYTRLVQRWLFR